MLKSVILYHLNFGKHIGGSEIYAAEIIKILDGNFDIYLKPNNNLKKNNINEYLKKYFDIVLKNRIIPSNIFTKGIFINCSINSLINLHKHSIHIIHFPRELKIRLRKNIYKFILSIFQNIFYSYSYSYYICNSYFTKYYFKKYLPKVPEEKIKVIYPPVNLLLNNSNLEKFNQILIFSRIEPEKKIEILINAFINNFNNINFKLIIIGSINDNNNKNYYNKLKTISNNNIVFNINLDKEKVNEYLCRSLIFWHAKGFENNDPMLFEHFGITTVEAMSAGVIPIVINKGGQKEIVDHDVNGYKWDTIDDLIYYTNKVILMPKEERARFSNNAIEKSKLYSVENFKESFLELINSFTVLQ